MKTSTLSCPATISASLTDNLQDQAAKMETPIYYSYQEFLDNYKTDFENFRKKRPSAAIEDFFHEVSVGYLVWENKIPGFVNCEVASLTNLHFSKTEISIFDFVEVVSKYVFNIAKSLQFKSTEGAFDYLVEIGSGVCYESYLEIPGNVDVCYRLQKNVILKHKTFFNFLTPDQPFDADKYFDFRLYAINRIQDFMENYHQAEIETKQHDKDLEGDLTEISTNIKKRIALLLRSGIIDFLIEKNPKITFNKIAAFIQEITKEPMKQPSINPYLSSENDNYALRDADIEDLDLILKRYSIEPKKDTF